MNPKVESIKIKIDGKLTIDLTPEQARALFSELKSILGENTYVGVPAQVIQIPIPYRDYSRPFWGEFWCDSPRCITC